MAQQVKNPPAVQGAAGGVSSIPGLGMATHSSIFARKSHGQRSVAGYSPWGPKESNTTDYTWQESFLAHWCVTVFYI